MADNKNLDKIALLKKTQLVRGHFPSWDKIVLLTHFPQFHLLFSIKSYFTNILLFTFLHFTNIKSISSPFSILKRIRKEEMSMKD